MTPYPESLKRFPTVRQSRLAIADRCLLQSRFSEELERGFSSVPQARGTLFHRVAEKLLRTLHETGERKVPTDVAIAALEEALRQADVPDSELVNLPLAEVKELRWMTVKFAHDLEWDIGNLVALEEPLEATISYPDGAGGSVRRRLTGRPDALFIAGPQEDEIVCLDYKTGWSMPAPSELDWDGTYQLRSYGWLILRSYPSIERVTLREVYVRYSEFRESQVYRNDLPNIENELAALVERFDRAWHARVFPPSPGTHCQTCPKPSACPIFPDVRAEGMITDEATAKKVAGEAIVARAALKQREQALKAWSSVHGPTPINSTPGRERVWGFRSRKRVSRPTREELEKAMFLHGSHLNLDDLYKENVGTRFEPHAPQPVEDAPDDAALMQALEASIDKQKAENAAPEPSSSAQADEERAA